MNINWRLIMKKYLIIAMAMVIISALAIGCTTSESDETPNDIQGTLTDTPMSEAPKAEMSQEPEMTEQPMAEESEEPMENEEMTVGKKTEAGYIDVTPEEAKKLIETVTGLVIIDVSPLYDSGHIPGAINFYVGDGSLDAAIPGLDMNVPYLVYCHSDSASISGARKLIEAGFETVYRLEGNFGAWLNAGYPVE